MHANHYLSQLGNSWGKYLHYFKHPEFPGYRAEYDGRNACIQLFEEISRFIECVKRENFELLSSTDKKRFATHIGVLQTVINSFEARGNGKEDIFYNRLNFGRSTHSKIDAIKSRFRGGENCSYIKIKLLEKIIFSNGDATMHAN